MSRLHPVFNVVKLTAAPLDPIVGHHPKPPPPPEIVNEEEEWIVEEILDSIGNCVTLSNGKVLELSTILGNLGTMFMPPTLLRIFIENILVQHVKFKPLTLLLSHFVECRVITPLRRG